jgi:hypothetical protein
MPYKDPEQQALVIRTWRGVRAKEWNALKGGPCSDCGNSYPPECMQWDHRLGETKVRSISSMWSQSREKVLAEIAKCDLVCANCHAIRTKARIVLKERLAVLPGKKPARPKTIREPRAPKGSCLRGHDYDEANTYTYRGKRHCRTCNRMASRKG